MLRVVSHDQLIAETLSFADRIAARPRLAVQMGKSFYNRGLTGDQIQHAIDGVSILFTHDDAREGVAAFREKREPKFL